MLSGLLLSACATPLQTLRLAELPPANVARQVELVNTAFFPQQRYQCGPAALATVLTGLGVNASPESLETQVYLPGRKGSLQVELLAATRHYQLLPVQLPPRLESIILELAAGKPVLILQNLAFSWAPRWHYAVVVGYDLDARELVLRSGTMKRRVTPFATFERTWQRSGYWAVAVVTPDQVPASASPLAYLEAVHAFEARGELTVARRGYASASRRWPGNALALMGLGNSAYAQQDYTAAEHAFRETLAAHPHEAPAWNNLAYALHAQGCQREAIAAAQCAQRLVPDEAGFRESVNELAQRVPITGNACRALPQCPLL